MLKDAGFLSEKDAEWENRKRERKGLKRIEPLFTVDDAKIALRHFKGLVYGKKQEILPGSDPTSFRCRSYSRFIDHGVWLDDGQKYPKTGF